MCRVGAHDTAAIGAGLLGSDLAGLGIQGQILLSNNLSLWHDFAVYHDSVGFRVDLCIGKHLIAVCGLHHSNGLENVHGFAAAQGLGYAQGNQCDGDDNAEGHHYVQRGTDQISPEIADAFFTNFHQAADQGKQHCNAAGGGNKVLYRQAQGLGQVGQSEFAGVCLPVCVGDKAGGGVESQMPAQTLHALGIPGKNALQHQDGEQENQSRQVECKSAEQIFLPPHVFIFIDVEQFIDSIFTRTQDPG